MGTAFRCDNPNCRKFIDGHEEKEKWAEVNVYFRKAQERIKHSEISTTIYVDNNRSYSPNYILCPDCTKKLIELLGIENYEFN